MEVLTWTRSSCGFRVHLVVESFPLCNDSFLSARLDPYSTKLGDMNVLPGLAVDDMLPAIVA
jgi:hypothetical protein